MLSNPKIGMKVRIVGYLTARSSLDGVPTYEFCAKKGDTGTLIDIDNHGRRGHGPKTYTVTLDPPNWGDMVFLGTENLETYTEETNND